VDATTKASTAVATILAPLVLDGRMVPMEALLPPRYVAPTMVDQGGEDGMRVKEPQPQLRADIARVFPLPPGGDHQAPARTVDLGHGRIEPRHRTTREALVGDSAGPGLAQACELGPHVMVPKTGQERVEGVYGVTSLRPAQATPER
jgi:hypothetical protein